MSSVEAEIASRFGKLEDDTFVDTFKKVMSIFNLSVDDLFLKWESYNLANQDLEPTSVNLTRLQASIQAGLAKKLTPASLTKLRPKNLSSPSFMNNILPSTPLTNSTKKRKLESTPLKTPKAFETSSPLSKFDTTPSGGATAQDSGKIIETLNPQIAQSQGLDFGSEEKAVRLAANFDAKKYQFRTMRQKLLEAADVLDDQIDTFIQLVQELNQFQDDEFGNPAILSQHSIIAVGRIVPDSPLINSDIALNESSLSLETSRVSGIGQRVPLDLKKLTDFSFFPGQIVALKGINPTGELFVVENTIQLPLLGSSISSKEEIEEIREITQGNNVKVIVTAGPYTTNKNLEYDHLESLVERVNTQTKPHLMIMLGPFVDITHPKIMDGTLVISGVPKQPRTLDDVFRTVVTPILRKINSKIQVILIPSTKDASIKHAAYPQDSFNKKVLQLPKNFKCFPNPSSFQVNDILVGVSHNDIFKDLKDINRGKYEKENRFDRISRHVIEQRRYYPSFPAGTKTRKIKTENGEELIEHISGADLDLPYLGLTEFNDVIPDIMIMPSELRFFSKVVSNVLVINPSSFVRLNSNGQYCVLDIEAPDTSKLTEVNESDYLHDVWNRVRVDIVRT